MVNLEIMHDFEPGGGSVIEDQFLGAACFECYSG